MKKFKKALDLRGIDGIAGIELLEKSQLVPAKVKIETRLAEIRNLESERLARRGEIGNDPEKNAREIIAFLDSIGITAFGEANAKKLLEKFKSDVSASGSKFPLEHGRPDPAYPLEKGAKNVLASAMVKFVKESLGRDVFDETATPPAILANVNIASEFAANHPPLFDRASGILKFPTNVA